MPSLLTMDEASYEDAILPADVRNDLNPLIKKQVRWYLYCYSFLT